ncbi:MAG: hypothetical protein IJV84_04540 [Bacteroidales bacterium]|nr:hypothetical protein [Bacteroidales bacterium]MBQ9722770.1 hypothetical protein [Bacteroidales bacterium]
MKNDIFNFRRFGKYFTTDIRTCWANFGLSLLTISLLFPTVLYIVTTAFNLILRSSWDGPDMGIRVFVFAVAMFCLVVTMPVKCYGRITEKQYGSFWLTLPASRLEKFVSMFIMTCIIVPITGTVLYLGADALICTLDHTCGRNLVAGGMELLRHMSDLQEFTMNLGEESLTVENATVAQELVRQINSPWLYVDDFFGITLPFLLGAVFFKNGKTVKTFLAIFAFSMATSIIMSPFLADWASEIVTNANNDPQTVISMFSHGIFKHLALIDTITDTIVNLALLVGIWFRIKTLKH